MKKYLLMLLLALCNLPGFGQAGSVDTAFGFGGIAHTSFQKKIRSELNISQHVLAHPDGSFYIAISTGATYISHRFADGTLDINYGEEGYSGPILFGGGGLMLQTDGKIIIGGHASLNNKKLFALTRLNTDGSVDKSFSDDGIQYTDFAATEINMIDLALQPDGRIVAIGRAKIGNSYHLALSSYLPDGTPDFSFSGDGIQTTNFSGWLNHISAAAVDSAGRIVVVGSTQELQSSKISVARFLPDGNPDNDFLTGGKGDIMVRQSSAARDVAIQQDGKIVIVGFSYDFQPGADHQDFAVVRLNTNGSLDVSFSDDGMQTTNFSRNADVATAVSIDASGKLFVSGTSSPGIIPNVLMVSYNTDGSVDRFFTGASGIFIWPTSMALQPDGKVLISGYPHNYYVPEYWVLRFDTDGTLDENFGINGKLSDYKPSAATRYYTSVIQPDGKIIAAGTTLAAGNADFAIVRYNTDGKLDHSFADDGKAIIAFGAGEDVGYAIALEQNGRIVIAGYADNGHDRDIALVRLNPDGTPDLSFSGDGLLLTDYNGHTEEATALAIQPDGKIVVGGTTSNAGNGDFFLARYMDDGTPDNSFSGDGQLITDLGSVSDSLADLIVLPNGTIIAVGSHDVRGQSAFAITRYHADGRADLSYKGSGMLITDMGMVKAVAASASLQEDGKLIVLGSAGGADFLLVRYLQDGSLDTSFSNNGKLIFDMGSTSETATALVVQANGKILVAGYLNGSRDTDFAIARFTNDGLADMLFSADGKVIIDGGFGNDRINSVNILADRAYAVGTSDYIGMSGVVTALLLDGSNQPPVAGAYLQKYTSPITILLAAWGAYDPDGGSISYLWRKEGAPAGDTSRLMYGNSASPVLNGVIPGDYVLRLTVTDEDGATANTTLKFTVQPNQPPVAGTWLQKYYSPTSALLAAWGSYDPEGWPITYWWEKTAGPEGSTLMYRNSASPVITGLSNGNYTYLLTVTDFHGATDTAMLSFTVDINLPPIAAAWLQKYYSPTSVLLSAWDSHDPEGEPIAYHWENIAGPEGSTLLYHNSASPVLTGLVNGTYTYRLTVTDKKLATASKDLTFTISGVPLSSIQAKPLVLIYENGSTAAQFVIYPNPVNEVLNFRWDHEYTGDVLLTIINTSGQEVRKIRINKTLQKYNGSISLNGLRPGQYYLHLTSGKKKIAGISFIKD